MSLRSIFTHNPKKVYKKSNNLYHGSPVNIKGYIKPHKSWGRFRKKLFSKGYALTYDKIPKVYATNNFDMAVFFAAWNKEPSMGFETNLRNKFVIRVNKKQLKLLKQPGYIYEVKSEGFKGSRFSISYTSDDRVKILKTHKIANIYEYMRKNPKFIIKVRDK